jgi:hypothetical protein
LRELHFCETSTGVGIALEADFDVDFTDFTDFDVDFDVDLGADFEDVGFALETL